MYSSRTDPNHTGTGSGARPVRRRQYPWSSASRKIRTAARTKRVRLAPSPTTRSVTYRATSGASGGERELEPLRLEIARHPQPLSQMLRCDRGVIPLLDQAPADPIDAVLVRRGAIALQPVRGKEAAEHGALLLAAGIAVNEEDYGKQANDNSGADAVNEADLLGAQHNAGVNIGGAWAHATVHEGLLPRGRGPQHRDVAAHRARRDRSRQSAAAAAESASQSTAAPRAATA